MKTIFFILTTISKLIGFTLFVVTLFLIFMHIEKTFFELSSNLEFAVYYIGCGDIIFHVSIKYAKMIRNE